LGWPCDIDHFFGNFVCPNERRIGFEQQLAGLDFEFGQEIG